MSARMGRGRIKDLLREMEEKTLDALAEVIAEDLEKIDLKLFARFLLECCSVDCIAAAIARAEEQSNSSNRGS